MNTALRKWNRKKCPNCNKIKELEKFHNNKSRLDGKSGWCKICMKPLLEAQRNKENKRKSLERQEKSREQWIDLPNEEWKDIVGYKDYQVSNKARIRSIIRGFWRLKKASIHKSGYCYTNMRKDNGKYRTVYLHKAVAMAFLPNPSEFLVIKHIDGNKTNCLPENLEWCTQKHNVYHAIKILRRHGSLRKSILLST